MLQPEYAALAKYRLEKANNDLKAAKINLDNQMYGLLVNRSYYAMFHAIWSLLAIRKMDSKRHSTIIGMFNKEFCATGVIDSRFNAIVTKAFQIRMMCDYDDFYIVNVSEAEKQFNNAIEFVAEIENYLLEKYPEITEGNIDSTLRNAEYD